MKNLLLIGWSIAWLSQVNMASPLVFDFKDPKGVNNAVFKLDAPLEIIHGTATGISGKITFDPQNPGASRGELVVDTRTLTVGNPLMKEHLHGDKWMDTAQFPQIVFKLERLSEVQTADTTTTAMATGTLTIKGVAKTVTVAAKAAYLKDKLKARGGQQEGDLLVIRTSFTIKRSDFGINQGRFEDKVSDVIDLTLSIVGSAPK